MCAAGHMHFVLEEQWGDHSYPSATCTLPWKPNYMSDISESSACYFQLGPPSGEPQKEFGGRSESANIDVIIVSTQR